MGLPGLATVHEWRAIGPQGRGWTVAGGLFGFLVPPFVPAVTVSWAGGLGAATVGSVYFWALSSLWFSAMHNRRKLES